MLYAILDDAKHGGTFLTSETISSLSYFFLITRLCYIDSYLLSPPISLFTPHSSSIYSAHFSSWKKVN